jgi:hypothetical protein
MSQKKDLKRAVKAVWDEVKTLRSERGKQYTPEEVEVAAAELGQHAKDLRLLSQRMSALSAMPPKAKTPKPKKKAASTES